MRTVVFVVPYPAEASIRFARAFAELKAVRLIGLVQKPPTGAAAKPFANFVKVNDAFDVGQLIEGCEKVRKKYGGLHQIVGVLEPLQVPLAEARAWFKLPGTDPKTADLFRDKAKMKDALRAAGLPCARHKVITSLADAVSFVREVGFPIVIKPPAGAGTKATWRVKNLEELQGVVAAIHPRPDNPTLGEEFLKGREYCFDTITVKGRILFENVSRYYPGPLEVIENPWIQWCCVLPRDISGPEYNGIKVIADKTIAALGLKDGMTHMEWFQRPDGSLAIGEIAMRPPGANISVMTGYAHEEDLYRAWVRAVVDGAFDGKWERQYAVGTAFLRGMGRGRVAGVTGVAEAQRQLGPSVVEAKLPTIGAPKSDSYEGDGYVIVRDPSTEVVKQLLSTIIQTVRVYYAD